MKRTLQSMTVCVAFAFAFAACGGGEQPAGQSNNDTSTTKTDAVEKCVYAYVHDSTRVQWIAYKFTEKAGVNGRFDSTEVSGTTESENKNEVLKGAAFRLFVASTETNDKGRNEKIVQHVFGKMMNTSEITGSIKDISSDGSTVTLSIKMNDIEKELSAPASWDGEKITVRTDINLEDWNAGESVIAITNACKANHTGSDGIPKVWPDVTIIVSTTLAKTCSE